MTDQALLPQPETPKRMSAFAGERAIAPAVEAVASGTPPTGGVPARRIGDRSLFDSEVLESIDRKLNAGIGRLSLGVSPVALVMAYFDWVAHLSASPGKRLQLAERALANAQCLNEYVLRAATDPNAQPCIDPARDHRFAHEGWRLFPFNLVHQAFLLNQQWWQEATTGLRGVSPQHERAVSFFARQLLDMISPSNVAALNPEVLHTTLMEQGPTCDGAPSTSLTTSDVLPPASGLPARRPSRWDETSRSRRAKLSCGID